MTRAVNLSLIARAGFSELSSARAKLVGVSDLLGIEVQYLLDVFQSAADPDRALGELERLAESHVNELERLFPSRPAAERLVRVLGGSRGLSEFIQRHPRVLSEFIKEPSLPESVDDIRASLCASVGAVDGFSDDIGDDARDRLRIRYREFLLQISIYDLASENPLREVEVVTAALSDIAGAAIEAALCVARSELTESFSRADIASVDLAVIGMGKCGARELNYLSDVDVIYVAESRDVERLSSERALLIATRLAQHTGRSVYEVSKEPGLWEVDANLRPEGKDGVLVRTLDSHLAYYDRWAKDWEFQALLKARPIAGSVDLGNRYVAGVSPKVWSSASRSNFVEQVQRMRQRVTEHIPKEDIDYQIKLGPGGLRDIEFTVQLLQLVHGLVDESVRQRGTLEALNSLAAAGYVGRAEAASFAENYRMLRLMEHRMQLRDLSRTHLMPRDTEGQRVLARATGIFSSDVDAVERWQQIKLDVRQLHERLFYRPLLAAVAQLPEETHQLTSEQAQARLSAIGFRDARGALHHIAALTSGMSRRAAIQRALLPIMLQWFSDGADPDQGLLSFRRLSEKLGESHWFLRMLRDSAGAAQRLTRVLSGSRYVSDLLERIPEAAAWFDGDEDLAPRTLSTLSSEIMSILARHDDDKAAQAAVHAMRRREVLRLAIGGIIGLVSMTSISRGLSDVTTAVLQGLLAIALRECDEIGDVRANPEFAIMALGRFGGGELGFGSDADVLYVYRATLECNGGAAQKRAERIVARIGELAQDQRLPFEIDTDLRPEGKSGATVRSLDSYRAYYARWSLLWEAQALLRAAPAAGSVALLDDFRTVIDPIRYPENISPSDAREIRRMKARVESERLPQGADPARHVKLGRGSLSDVEWTVQLLQLQHGATHPALQTTSTRSALAAAVSEGLMEPDDAEKLDAAWVLATRVRSAITIWSNKSTDVLPSDRTQLEGIARLLEYPPGSATALEEDYLGVTRRARNVFERVFYGAS
ncbi:bifunctional [glutamine synthetase] adenylyltransferase/[glutamine synthetase]-adenylyl-L-tyrosine phosphorylase [Alpinimonas psychrophila]|uniref:Glutamate-ammonia-ligase adenylyltransferase n=1 Tax=Alpinimonas psychrophila TaxID=748908 RepID=A0A7W3JSR5_9MICO|nr:glutamate-ammonia-ligase adenylyltransferase [Alpinimonas psychrophila]